MKIGKILLLLAIMVLAGCQKEPVSPTDPKPFPMDANKDLSVAPGNDFFRYCNGTWLDNARIPEGKTIYGGLYIALNLAKDKLAALYAEDPVLSKVSADLKENLANPEASKAYIDRLVDMVPDPSVTSIEEYIRLIGRFTRMGVKGPLEVFIKEGEDILEASLFPMIFLELVEDIPEPEPSAGNKGEKSIRFMELLAEGMGIDPSYINMSQEEIEGDVYAVCLEVDREALAEKIKEYIRDLDRFTDGSKTYDDLFEDVESATSIYAEYLFAKKYASESLKKTYVEVCEKLRTQFSKRIASLDWMSDATKAYAQEKLSAMSFHVAYPDNWFEETFPTLEGMGACSSFVEEYVKLVASKLDFSLSLAGKAYKDYKYELSLADGSQISTVGASYDTRKNALFINTSTLLPPVISDEVTEARTYAVFAIVGHEMTHGFDVDGAEHDKDGQVNNWWTVADKMEFEDRMQNLVECYNHLEIAPDIMPQKYCDGTVTLEENIADLGGVSIALDAYTEYLQEQGFFGSALQDQQRKFFESYADIWCCLYGQEFIEKQTTGKRPDKHALPRERINGVVMNLDLWYDLYGVTRENLLYLPPERRTRIW